MKTRIQRLLLSVIALVFTLSITAQTKANPIQFAYAENANLFNLTVTSGPLDANLVLNLALGNNWSVTLNIVETSRVGVISDEVTIIGTAIHNVGPHGEGPNAVGVNFLFNAEGIAFAAGVNQVQLIQIIEHGGHFNQFNAILTFTVVHNPGLGSDIIGYTFTWDGVHTLTNQPIPEPATLLLLGTGLLGVAARARRRRKVPKTQEE